MSGGPTDSSPVPSPPRRNQELPGGENSILRGGDDFQGILVHFNEYYDIRRGPATRDKII